MLEGNYDNYLDDGDDILSGKGNYDNYLVNGYETQSGKPSHGKTLFDSDQVSHNVIHKMYRQQNRELIRTTLPPHHFASHYNNVQHYNNVHCGSGLSNSVDHDQNSFSFQHRNASLNNGVEYRNNVDKVITNNSLRRVTYFCSKSSMKTNPQCGKMNLSVFGFGKKAKPVTHPSNRYSSELTCSSLSSAPPSCDQLYPPFRHSVCFAPNHTATPDPPSRWGSKTSNRDSVNGVGDSRNNLSDTTTLEEAGHVTNLQHISEREHDDLEQDPSLHPTAGPLFLQRARDTQAS